MSWGKERDGSSASNPVALSMPTLAQIQIPALKVLPDPLRPASQAPET